MTDEESTLLSVHFEDPVNGDRVFSFVKPVSAGYPPLCEFRLRCKSE